MWKSIYKYVGIFEMQLKLSTKYKFSFISGIIGSLLQIAIQIAIWSQVYMHKVTINGLDKRDMFTYLMVSQSLVVIFSFRNAPERMISKKIRQGDIVYELSRPIHFMRARFFENMGDSLINIALAFFMIIFWSLGSDSFSLPSDIDVYLFFGLSSCFSYMIMFSVSILAGYLTFFTMNFWGIYNAKKAIVDLLSGALIPISFFPQKIQKLFSYMPFEKMVYTPVMIFLEKYAIEERKMQLMIQFFWTVILLCLDELIYRKAIRSITINGG